MVRAWQFPGVSTSGSGVSGEVGEGVGVGVKTGVCRLLGDRVWGIAVVVP